MVQNITKGVTIPIDEALKLVGSENHVLIDLRDIPELQRAGKIPGAFFCPSPSMREF